MTSSGWRECVVPASRIIRLPVIQREILLPHSPSAGVAVDKSILTYDSGMPMHRASRWRDDDRSWGFQAARLPVRRRLEMIVKLVRREGVFDRKSGKSDNMSHSPGTSKVPVLCSFGIVRR